MVEQSVNYYRERENVVAGYKLAKNKNGPAGTSEQLGSHGLPNLPAVMTLFRVKSARHVSVYRLRCRATKVPQFHKDRGWEDMPERLKRIIPQIDARFEQTLEDYLTKFGER